MFRHENVKRVRFDFVAIDPLVAGVEEGTFVYRTTPDILVEIDCGDGEPIAYVVQDTWLELTVGEDPGNGDLWVILDMEEIHKSPGLTDALGSAGPAAGGLLATATSTLGSIKSMFIVASEEDRTADMALEDYMAAVASEDIALYSDCLDFDHRYIFTDDVADSLHLPPEAPWWGKSEDLEVMTIMFGHPHVTRIDFDYVSLSSDTTWVGGNKIVRTRVRPDILLRLESPGEEPWHFVVQDVFMDFAFVRRGCCLETWTLLSVEEIPMNPGRSKNAGLALTEATSWGEVKAMFVP
jgi:hypothetical protein